MSLKTLLQTVATYATLGMYQAKPTFPKRPFTNYRESGQTAPYMKSGLGDKLVGELTQEDKTRIRAAYHTAFTRKRDDGYSASDLIRRAYPLSTNEVPPTETIAEEVPVTESTPQEPVPSEHVFDLESAVSAYDAGTVGSSVPGLPKSVQEIKRKPTTRMIRQRLQQVS